MNKLLANRFSAKDYDPTHEITLSEIEMFLEAAKWSPSSYNEQPWRFYHATRQNTSGHAKLYSAISDGNKPWSGEASLLILAVANTQFSRNGKTNRHAFYDLGQSVASLIFQATDMGYNIHQMGGFDVEVAKRNLALAEGLEPVAMIAVGKRLGKDLPENRKRKSLDEIAVSVK